MQNKKWVEIEISFAIYTSICIMCSDVFKPKLRLHREIWPRFPRHSTIMPFVNFCPKTFDIFLSIISTRKKTDSQFFLQFLNI